MPLPETQKAVVIPSHLAPYTLSTLPIPTPGNDELLVKVHATGLNPADWKVAKYGVLLIGFPAVAGFDIAGEVVQSGSGAGEKFAKGDRVVFGSEFSTKEYGGFQQYALADARTAAIIPPNVSYDEAATLPAALGTAYAGLYDIHPRGLGLEPFITSPGKYAGQAIFVAGGSSSVGQGVIQLARLSGFSHIITTSSLKHAPFLKSIGATQVLDRSLTLEALTSSISSIPNLPPIEYAFDAIGDLHTSFTSALSVISLNGRVVTVDPSIDATEVLKADRERTGASDGVEKKVSSFGMVKRFADNERLTREISGAMEGILASGEVKPQRFEILEGGLAGVTAGLKRLEEGKVSGVKLVARPQETA